MFFFKKPVLIIVLTIAGLVAGFIFLLKGCLAKYDERFVKTPALWFEKKGKQVIFTVEEFQKTTSYSQKGGFTSRTVNTSYSVQVNDGETAALLLSKKVKGHKEVKNFPIEMLGPSGDTAWLFMGEPMAFDAFTLEKIADIGILEEKNKALKNKFPAERRFYVFNRNDQQLYITATDGSKWKLNTHTLIAEPADFMTEENTGKNNLLMLEKEIKAGKAALDSLFRQKNMQAARDYSSKKISMATYQQVLKEYYAARELLTKKNDSLTDLKRMLEKNKRQLQDNERAIENLQRSSASFTQIKANQDTANAAWYGLYSAEEFSKLNERVNIQVAYEETTRRNLYRSAFYTSQNGEKMFSKDSAQLLVPAGFLDGGFLLNKMTAQPIRLPGTGSFIIVYKDQIGSEGKIIVSIVDQSGKSSGSYNTQLAQWNDWIYSETQLYIFGTNNKNLSTGETNILLSINLKDMSATGYDYFTRKPLTLKK